jgi:hypothetical protein
MSFIKDIGHDLVEKKLWPFAAILLVLIVAVPMTLAKPGAATISPTLPTKIAEEEIGPELALTRAVNTGFERAPRVSTTRLDPFGRRSKAKVEKAASQMASAANSVASGDGGGASTSPTTQSTDPGTTTNPSPKPTPVPTVKTEEDDLLSVLFTEEDVPDTPPVALDDIRTLSPLPDADDPFLVYVGKADADRASFLVSADVTVSGDGECSPSPQDCRTLTLSIGQTAHFVLLSKNAKKIAMTMTDMETKRVAVEGTDGAEKAAKLENKGRAVGAKALISVLKDDTVVESLMHQHVKIRS